MLSGIIKNTTDHLERLKIKLNKEEINKFLLSTGFLFQGLDRVQFFSLDGELVGDTNILDLDPKVFLREEPVLFNTQNEKDKFTVDTENTQQQRYESHTSCWRSIKNDQMSPGSVVNIQLFVQPPVLHAAQKA